jgi:hypothetical protein
MTPRGFFLTAILSFCALPAIAEDSEPSAILELGGVSEFSLKDHTASFGPNLAAEVTPIEDWLELEAGVSPMFSPGRTEWQMDFLFKKPFTLSDQVEFMPGVGPEWDHAVAGGRTTDSVSAEAALDFMFWPERERRFGWYLEPSYGYSFAAGHEQSLAVSAGLLIPIP